MIDVTILMPCLNEAETLATCITKAKIWSQGQPLSVEIVIADNGSTDGSQAIARELGATVVEVTQRGYGSALFAGAMAARGRWIIMGDADDSYDFGSLDDFVAALESGADVVIGDRFKGGIAKEAMPWKNRYLGNPILSGLGRVLFGIPVRDFHCGLRAITKEAFLRLELRTTGMEFASEMVIKAANLKMNISEVPTTLSKDGRSRPPHLRPWRDGWRHLRFMMLFSPKWLFIFPGATALILSSATYLMLLQGPLKIGNVTFDIHSLLVSQVGINLGLLALLTGIAARTIGIREGFFIQNKPSKSYLKMFNSEVQVIFGLVVSLVGLISGVRALGIWENAGFGPLNNLELLRTISLSTLLLSSGGIVFVFGLLQGFLSLPKRRD